MQKLQTTAIDMKAKHERYSEELKELIIKKEIVENLQDKLSISDKDKTILFNFD